MKCCGQTVLFRKFAAPRSAGSATTIGLLDLVPVAPPPIPPEGGGGRVAALFEGFFTTDTGIHAPPPVPVPPSPSSTAKHLRKSDSWFRNGCSRKVRKSYAFSKD